MWIHNGKEYTGDEVVSKLADTESGIVALDGPSGCGKTTIIKTLQTTSVKIVSGEFASAVIKEFERSREDPVNIALRFLEGYEIVCFEDVDLYLKERPSTTSFIKKTISNLSSNCLVIVSGIDLLNRVPELISELNVTYYVWDEKGD
ncbi:MAG: AAA family ATPase [Oscillospiraceae bacterium]|nr:AAA family ATPase [Oscillospiraceae bacterium]